MSGKTKNSDDRLYIRMTFNERVQHFLLFSSFIVLILTGFGLKFPEAFWVRWIVYIIGEHAFEARGIVHRIASLVMIGASLYHLYYIIFTPTGRKLVIDFLPKKQDIIDFKDSMLYLVGKTDIKPKMGRFSYIEKMEYWAVVWGTVIMGGTGFVLWFENFFLKYVGTMGMDISTAIHYYEAILASLAILVWHFYFIFLNPDVYPMNKAWFKGFMTRKEMEHEHPLELEMLDEQEAEAALKNNIETDKSAEKNPDIITGKKRVKIQKDDTDEKPAVKNPAEQNSDRSNPVSKDSTVEVSKKDTGDKEK